MMGPASSEINADLIKMRMEEAGIPCVTLGDDTAGLFGQAMLSRIMVPRDVARARADEIREIIATIEPGVEPGPRSPYLVRMPRGCVITSALVAAPLLATVSVISLISGWPWGRVGGGVGVVLSALLGWLGVTLLIRIRRERAGDEADDQHRANE